MTRLFSRASLALILILSACGAEATGSPIESSPPPPSPTETETESPEPTATAEPTESGTSEFTWAQAGQFADEGRIQLVADVVAWRNGWMAVGNRWNGNAVAGDPEPRVWNSDDGRSWTASRPRLGASGVELHGILLLSAGGVIIIGSEPIGDGSTFRARAWTSEDGEQWTALELPDGIAGPSISVASSGVGNVISTGRALWYSAEGDSWQRVHRADPLYAPAAGDEGFVAPSGEGAPGAAINFASGDGLTWFEGTFTNPILGAGAWRGDWLGWAYTDDPSTISILSSADGLEWTVDFDVNDLTPADGPKAGQGLESQITEVDLSGEGGVIAMTLGWNHCCAMPPQGSGVYISTDAVTWSSAGLPENTYVRDLATDGTVVVLAANVDRGREVSFWVADR